ncbi:MULTISPECIES: hypothetical protein [unclassified Arthrobacter]|uniref:hypothetical protein n=1 Tax=unclassified Arthrobacter TaxID=235627 RepID=UPI002DF97216|nr:MULTISPECIES: hypothetical protein [unclassified Arthrobacter]MEC5189955.1 hypothetical protein [Arthrobacter sp. MP_M4]MEC5201423.1 hypothetical protein [Arthrobacter sp. MP_M7]
MSNDQQPGVPQHPENNGWPQPAQQNQQGQPGPDQTAGGQPPYPPHPDQTAGGQPPYPPHQDQTAGGQPPYPPRAGQDNFGQPPYGAPYQGPYGQPGPGQFGQAPPPKGGIPVWGWVAGGIGITAVLAVAGVMVLGGLVSGKGNEAAPAPAPTESTRSSGPAEAGGGAATDGSSAAASGGDVYLFQDADFTSPPVWSIKIPGGWKMSNVKGGTITYRSGENPCIFTTHQAILPPRDATADEQATADTMKAEIEGVKTLAGSPVSVVTEAGSSYTKLRNSNGQMIELQEAELRFQNKSSTDLVYRIAARSMPASNGLMELTLVCPADLPTEAGLWSELRDSVIMVDDPAA